MMLLGFPAGAAIEIGDLPAWQRGTGWRAFGVATAVGAVMGLSGAIWMWRDPRRLNPSWATRPARIWGAFAIATGVIGLLVEGFLPGGGKILLFGWGLGALPITFVAIYALQGRLPDPGPGI